jgi:hypothetical protein
VALMKSEKLGYFRNIKIFEISVSLIDMKYLAMILGVLDSGKPKRSKFPLLGEGYFGNFKVNREE